MNIKMCSLLNLINKSLIDKRTTEHQKRTDEQWEIIT